MRLESGVTDLEPLQREAADYSNVNMARADDPSNELEKNITPLDEGDIQVLKSYVGYSSCLASLTALPDHMTV